MQRFIMLNRYFLLHPRKEAKRSITIQIQMREIHDERIVHNLKSQILAFGLL
jgi:hypothetical protein